MIAIPAIHFICKLYVKQPKLNQSTGRCYENNLMFIFATALCFLTGGNLQESDWVCPNERFLDPPAPPPLINFVDYEISKLVFFFLELG